jgi:hypothetical protein
MFVFDYHANNKQKNIYINQQGVYTLCLLHVLKVSLIVFVLCLPLFCVNFDFGTTHDNEICWFFGRVFMYQI